jgi:hypothetical protein
MPDPILKDSDKAAMIAAINDSFADGVGTICGVLRDDAAAEYEQENPDYTKVVGRARNGLKYLLWLKATMLGLVEEISGK